MTILKCKKSWAWLGDYNQACKVIKGQFYVITTNLPEYGIGVRNIHETTKYSYQIGFRHEEIDEYFYPTLKVPNNIQIL
jgi:hypothetical protein